MTQTDPDYTDEELDDDDGSTLVRDLRKQLKAANKRAQAAEDAAGQNLVAARRVAFLDAGIDLSNPATRFYQEHYQGDLTPDAIKADAIANGFLTADDHTAELGEIAGQSEGVQGGQAPAALGTDQEEYEREIDEAIRKAPRGQEAKAIDEVYKRYARTV